MGLIMNKRIKELLLESDIKFDKDIEDIDVCVMLPSDLGKFSDLIIKECTNLILSNAGQIDSMKSNNVFRYNIMQECANMIQHHFGVN